MKTLNSSHIIIFSLLFGTSAFYFTHICAFGDGGRKHNISPADPIYVEPKIEAKGRERVSPWSFKATIKDESSTTSLKNFSFSGDKAIGGIRKETDDSHSSLDLVNIKKVKIRDSAYHSKRHKQTFIRADVTANNNKVEKDLLIPLEASICGIDEQTHFEKSWKIKEVDKIIIGPGQVSETPEKTINAIYKQVEESGKQKNR